MRTLLIPVGCPGSGKTYWAKQMLDKYGIKSVSSDQVREDLYGNASIQGDYQEVFNTVYDAICNLFDKGEQIVILDATNVTRQVRKQAIFNIHPTEIIYAIFPDNLKRALINNKNRERVVPEAIVRRMYKTYKRDMPCTKKDFFKEKQCFLFDVNNPHLYQLLEEKYVNNFSYGSL